MSNSAQSDLASKTFMTQNIYSASVFENIFVRADFSSRYSHEIIEASRRISELEVKDVSVRFCLLRKVDNHTLNPWMRQLNTFQSYNAEQLPHNPQKFWRQRDHWNTLAVPFDKKTFELERFLNQRDISWSGTRGIFISKFGSTKLFSIFLLTPRNYKVQLQ